MKKFEVVYFKGYTRSNGDAGIHSAEIDAQNIEEAAYLFNRKYFEFFKGMGLAQFLKLPSYFQFWGLTINGFDYGQSSLECHRDDLRREILAFAEIKRNVRSFA